MHVLRFAGRIAIALALLFICSEYAVAQDTTAVTDTVAAHAPDHHTATDAAPMPPKAAPHWTAILPPLMAVVMSLVFRQVLVALFASVWLGVFLAADGGVLAVFTSFFGTMSDHVMPAIADEEHASIMIFSLMIGGMIGIVQANGGTQGIVTLMSKYIKNRRDGQVMTTILGFVVFFDDYANTMVVGNTMRPIIDKLRLTRAKLAYLVDSTSAPVATVALVSTWIGAMVAYIADAERAMASYNEAPYLVFVNSLLYNFYAWFTILFVAIISYSRKDFGPMLESRKRLLEASVDPTKDTYGVFRTDRKAEENARSAHWLNAVIPILVLVVGVLTGLYVTGEGSSIQEIIGSSNSYKALLWASAAAVFTAGVLTLSQRLISMHDMLKGFSHGMFQIFETLMILVLAWALSGVSKELGTADFLVSVFNESLDPFWVPAIVFIIAGVISFSTGTSWGTMGILMPLVIPLIWEICQTQGIPFEVAHELIYGAVASVLAGSVLGDHCSPISDTTILSALTSQCDLVEHTKTQMPYAMVVGAISLAGLIATFVLKIPAWIFYPAGIAVVWAVIHFVGKDPEADPHFAALAKAMDERDRQAAGA